MTPQSPSTATVKAEAPLSARSSNRIRTEADGRGADPLRSDGPRATQPESDDKYYDVPCTD